MDRTGTGWMLITIIKTKRGEMGLRRNSPARNKFRAKPAFHLRRRTKDDAGGGRAGEGGRERERECGGGERRLRFNGTLDREKGVAFWLRVSVLEFFSKAPATPRRLYYFLLTAAYLFARKLRNKDATNASGLFGEGSFRVVPDVGAKYTKIYKRVAEIVS